MPNTTPNAPGTRFTLLIVLVTIGITLLAVQVFGKAVVNPNGNSQPSSGYGNTAQQEQPTANPTSKWKSPNESCITYDGDYTNDHC